MTERYQSRVVAAVLGLFLMAAVPSSAWQLVKPKRPNLLPQDEDRLATRLTVELMPKMHLLHRPVDQDLYRRTLDEMLVVLDPRRLILTADDVRPFYDKADANTEALKQGNPEFAFDLVRLWVQRFSERMPWVIDMVNRPRTPAIDEFVIVRPSELAFTNDSRELQRRWLHWLILEQQLLGWDGASDESIRAQIVERYRRLLPGGEPDYQMDVRALLLKTFARCYDPRSWYMTEEESCYLSPRFKPKQEGIGLPLDWQDGVFTVKDILEAGPASDDGRLQVGDRVLAYVPDDKSNIYLPLQVRPGYREPGTAGPAGTQVRLLVLPRGKSEIVEYRIVRAAVDTSRLVTGSVMSGEQLPSASHRKVGYVKLSSFVYDPNSYEPSQPNRSTSNLVKSILEKFIAADVEIVVLDLRNNRRGSLSEMLDTAGLFLGILPVVQVPDPDEGTKSYAPEHVNKIWNGPLVVLTDRRTEQGAEVFVGALRDHQRALLIGDATTSGLGVIPSGFNPGNMDPNQPPNPKFQDHVSVVSSALYLPGGEGIQKQGVAPHIVLPSKQTENAIDQSTRFGIPNGERIAPAESPHHCGYPITAELRNQLTSKSLIRRSQSNYWQQPSQPRPVLANESPLRFRIDKTKTSMPTRLATESKLPDGDEHLNEAIRIAIDYLEVLVLPANRRIQG